MWWLVASALAQDTWILENARIVDALGERTGTIVLEGDRIASVGETPAEPVPGARVLDLQGATVIPGLVDAHVHLSLTPSGAFLNLSEEEDHALWRRHLAAYVAAGVTTVLDTGSVLADAETLVEMAAEGPAPDIHMLGPLVSPPGGYVNVVLPQFEPAATAADVARQIDGFSHLDPFGVKVTLERGMLQKIWPIYSDEVREALVAESARRPIPLYAHAISPEEYGLGLEMDVAGFVHPPQKLTKKLLEALKEADKPIVTTLSVFDSLLIAPEPERLDDPTLVLLVPEIERDAAADPEIIHRYSIAVASNVMPKMPGFVKNFAAGMFQKSGPLQGRLDKIAEVVRTLDEEGVMVVMGSDSGNWPVFPFEFHGFTSIREVEVLGEAGISNARALEISTLNGAKFLGMEDEIGTIEAGKRADLIVLDGDPLQDLRALRTPQWVFRAGEGRTPEDWMVPGG